MQHEFVPHARRRDEKTEAILDTAMKLLADEGLEALTLKRVAAELGLVTTALYRYYPSKDALVAALQRRAIAALHQAFREDRARSTGAAARLADDARALAPILAAARFYAALPETLPEPFRLVAILLGDPRTLVGDEEAIKAVPVVGAFLADAAVLFDAAARDGAITRGDAATRTLIFWATLHGRTQMAKLRRVAPDTPGDAELADQAARTFLVGLGASERALDRAARVLEPSSSTSSTNRKASR